MHLNCRNCHPFPGSTTMVRWRANCLAPCFDWHGRCGTHGRAEAMQLAIYDLVGALFAPADPAPAGSRGRLLKNPRFSATFGPDRGGGVKWVIVPTLTEYARMNLKSISLDRLVELRDRVDSTLSAKVVDHRRSLESELSKLSRFQGRAATKSAFGRGSARGVVAPKYRNPQNPSETWAGRGLKPRWLAAAIKTGCE
jgi:DNA-binding protein H-NS